MSKINFILGGDSITVFLDGNSYTINKQAHTYELVLKAVRSDNVDALRNAVNIKQGIAASLTKRGGGKVRIDGSQIFYGDYEVTGLIASRIFEVLRLGLDVKPMVNFLENLMDNPSKRAVDELFGFLDACKLPITADGHFLAYKRVRSDYFDVYTGKMDNSVGKVLEMPRNFVDEDKNRTCSAGLHFCSYDYLSHFSGDRIMVLKINPRDVVAIPSDYNNSKGRTCRYEVVDELPVNEYKLPERTLAEDYTNDFGGDCDDNWDEVDAEDWDESADEDDWSESSEEVTPEEEVDNLDADDIDDILDSIADGDNYYDIGESYGISEDAVSLIHSRQRKKVKSSDNTTGKLTPSDVKGIRNALNNGYTLAEIARDYGVHPRSVGRIRDGEAWSNV